MLVLSEKNRFTVKMVRCTNLDFVLNYSGKVFKVPERHQNQYLGDTSLQTHAARGDPCSFL